MIPFQPVFDLRHDVEFLNKLLSCHGNADPEDIC